MSKTSATWVDAKPRSRFAKSLSLGVTDMLFASGKLPFALFDFVFVFLLFQLSVWSSPYGRWGLWQEQFILAGAVFASIFVVTAVGQGLYDRNRRFDYFAVVRISAVAATIAAFISLTVVYFLIYKAVGRLTMLYGALGSFSGVLLLHLALAWLLRRNPFRFTIIGQSSQMKEVVEFCQSSPRSSKFFVFQPWEQLFDHDEIWTVDRLLAARVGDVVITQDALANQKVAAFSILLLQAKLIVVDEISFYSRFFEKLPIEGIDRTWILREGIARRNILGTALKRYLDIVASLIAMILVAPVLVILALAIKLEDGGPVLFVQPRQGRYSKPFDMFKFRTMSVRKGAEHASGGFTKAGDQRVTTIGKFLRPLHLDELPQLLNIFLGQMSLVGPRPEALNFALKMKAEIPLYELRYLVRPGLTGYAQISFGYAMDSVEDTKAKLAYDLYYLCNYAFWTDLQIMLRTVFFLAKGSR